MKLIQTWGTLAVTGKDDNVTTFLDSANAKFAMSVTLSLTPASARLRLRVYHALAALSLPPGRYCVSSIDTDESQWTGKYDSYIGIRNVILGAFCNAIINLKTSNG